MILCARDLHMMCEQLCVCYKIALIRLQWQVDYRSDKLFKRAFLINFGHPDGSNI